MRQCKMIKQKKYLLEEKCFPAKNQFSATAVGSGKDLKRDISLIKNYCITISMKKNNSIHKFILNIESILLSLELKGCANITMFNQKSLK